MTDSAAGKRTLWDKYVERISTQQRYPIQEASIPMRDGVQLAATVCLPHRSERPAPAIVCITPFDERQFIGPGTEAEFFQRHGYAYVLISCRGRGRSGGTWSAFAHDTDDGHDAIEWIAQQPWCIGKVGITGHSFQGWTALAAASSRPGHLACAVVSAPLDPDAIAGQPTPSIGDLPVDAESFPALDYPAIDIPILHVNGWHDLEGLGSGLRHYERVSAHSPAAQRQRLIVGPWSHHQTRRPHHSHGGVCFGSAAATDLNHVHRRWFEYWLRGVENGAAAEAQVQLFETGTNRWIEGDHWPIPGSSLAFTLQRDGALTREDVATMAPRTWRFDPRDPAGPAFDLDRYPFADSPLDQRAIEARADVLTWTSAPLENDLVISGAPLLRIQVESDAAVTELHAKLTDVGPDGESLLVTKGWVNVDRNGPIEIVLRPAHHAFRPERRLRVSVTSADAPWFPVRSGPVIVSIQAGSLSLPILRGTW